jgi:type 1 glutamine amidotransferase
MSNVVARLSWASTRSGDAAPEAAEAKGVNMMNRLRVRVGMFAGAILLAASVASTVVAAAAAPSRPPSAAAGAPAAGGGRGGGLPDPYVGKKKLLIWADVQTGFHHDNINHAMAVIERLGRESGAYVSVIRTDSQLVTKLPIVGRGTRYNGRSINARNLDQYDAIFFLGAGEGTLDSQQKADLLSFVKDDGKGLVVGHAAGVAFFDWPEWGNLIGGFMGSEYSVQPMPLIVEDPNFPGVQDFGKSFTFPDQFPVMKEPYVKGKVHTIIRLDWSKLTPEQQARRPDGDIPVVFALPYGKGRVFNSGFGHPDETWDDPRVQKMYFEAIKWAMGVTQAPVPLDK